MTELSAPLDDWVSRLADEAVAFAERNDTPVKVASGISPSGPIHLGNLREVMVPHLVADELRRRGLPVEHIISWDDFDRFRKVPAVPGVDASWEQHIGKPLTRVPAPHGSDAANWAEHFRRELQGALEDLGVEYRGISQTQMYTSGAYIDSVLHAMAQRARIDSILDRYRTLDRGETPAADTADQNSAESDADSGSGAAQDADGSGDSGYYPYKPYCAECGTDFTTVTAYDDESTELTYTCRCGHSETVVLREHTDGKLVWKVDWPMRWAYEKVTFEPSGVDHQSPGSSFAVGKDVAPIFGWRRPLGPMYAFVGIRGMAKMSSSKGGVPTAAIALRYLEPPLLRWLYGRKKPNQSFDVALDGELPRTYDEWDALVRKVDGGGAAQPGDVAAYARAASVLDTGTGRVRELPLTPRTMPYRTLASVVDITTGDDEQTLRILAALEPDRPLEDLAPLRPRLDRAGAWVAEQMPAEDRTVVRSAPDVELLTALTDEQREGLRLLLEGSGDPAPEGLGRLEDDWTLAGITHQVYGVAKVQRGLGADQIVKGDKELGAAQRAFFVLLYRLLVSRETGPRLPTLLLAIGAERVRTLLTAQ